MTELYFRHFSQSISLQSIQTVFSQNSMQAVEGQPPQWTLAFFNYRGGDTSSPSISHLSCKQGCELCRQPHDPECHWWREKLINTHPARDNTTRPAEKPSTCPYSSFLKHLYSISERCCFILVSMIVSQICLINCCTVFFPLFLCYYALVTESIWVFAIQHKLTVTWMCQALKTNHKSTITAE